MCERCLAMWAGLHAIMAYVINNGEIHAGPNINAARAGDQKHVTSLLRTVAYTVAIYDGRPVQSRKSDTTIQ